MELCEGQRNPADDASRGFDPRKETSNSRWFTGPAFLGKREELWPSYSEVTCVRNNDLEIKKDENSMQYIQLMMYLRMLKDESQLV